MTLHTYRGCPNNHIRGAQIQMLLGTCWKYNCFFYFTTVSQFSLSMSYICDTEYIHKVFFFFFTQTPKIIQEIWNKIFNHDPPTPNTIFNCFPRFCFRHYANLFNTVLITSLCDDTRWRTQMKILTVVGYGEYGQIFLFNFQLYFPIFHWVHSMLIMVTLHTKPYYQDTVTRSIGRTSDQSILL